MKTGLNGTWTIRRSRTIKTKGDETMNHVFVNSQGVILLNGQTANIDLEYDEEKDVFIVTADCDGWAYDYAEFVKKNYPEDDPTETIDDAINDCKEISGRYYTLKEINEKLNRYCDDYYDFTWEYEDGTPVE